MCEQTVKEYPWLIKHIPIYQSSSIVRSCVNVSLKKILIFLIYVPDQFKTREMCEKAVKQYGFLMIENVSDKFKNKEMYKQFVKKYSV